MIINNKPKKSMPESIKTKEDKQNIKIKNKIEKIGFLDTTKQILLNIITINNKNCNLKKKDTVKKFVY